MMSAKMAVDASVGPWKQLIQTSLKRNEKVRHSRYFQIATVRRDGKPSNRTVVYRGFLWDTDRLTFVTDLRWVYMYLAFAALIPG